MNASVVLVIGHSVFWMALYFFVRPGSAARFIEIALENLWAVAALRVIIGVLLVLSSRPDYNRLPETVRVIGILVLLAGIVTPFIGRTVLADRWIAFARRHMRPLSLVSMALGAVLVYSAA